MYREGFRLLFQLMLVIAPSISDSFVIQQNLRRDFIHLNKQHSSSMLIRKSLNSAMEDRLNSMSRTFHELCERLGDPDIVSSPKVLPLSKFLHIMNKLPTAVIILEL